MYSMVFFSVVFIAITYLHGPDNLTIPDPAGKAPHQIGERYGWPHSFVVMDNRGESKLKMRSFIYDFGLLVVLPSAVVAVAANALLRRPK